MNFEDKLQVQIKVYDVGYVQVGDRFFDMNDNGEPNFEVEHENAGGGYDEDGNPYTIRVREEIAIAFQHEMDHLDGILFPDRIDKKNPFKDAELMREI